MIYIFSFVAGRYRWVMWLFLVLRWVGLAAAGSPVVAVSVLAFFAGAHSAILLVGAAIHVVLVYRSEMYSRHRKVMLLKRRWPVLWAQVQRKQLLDHDDGHLNRPWLAAPKLGFIYRGSGAAVSLPVRPAVGQTLEDLQSQASVLAAQTRLVDSLEVDYVKTASDQGMLKVLFKEVIDTTQTIGEKHAHTV